MSHWFYGKGYGEGTLIMGMDKIGMFSLLAGTAFVLVGLQQADARSGSRQYHRAMAQKYTALAKEMEAVVREHTQIKVDYRGRNEKETDEMARHCNAVIESARQLSEKYREFARWHRKWVVP